MLYNKRFQLAEVRHQRRRWRVHCWGLWSPQVRFLKEEKHFNLISCKKNKSIWSQLVQFAAVENLAQLDELFCRDTEPFSEFFEVVPSITFEMTKIKVHKINIFEETQAFHYPVYDSHKSPFCLKFYHPRWMIKETDQSRAHPLVKNIVQFSMTGCKWFIS